MKFVKRLTALLLVLLLTLSLCACNQKPEESSSTPSSTVTLPNEVPELTLDAKGWSNGGTLDGYRGLILNGRFYYQESGTLRWADLTTGVSTHACTRENCTHTNAFCEANFSPLCWFYQDGYIYSEEYDSGNFSLFRRSLDGTENTKIATPGQQYLDSGFSVTVGTPTVAEGVIYYVLRIESLVKSESGEFVTEKKCALMRLELETGTELLLGEYTDVTPCIIAAREGNVLFFTVQNFTEEELQDPNFFEIQELSSIVLQVWDAGYEGIVTLFESTFGEFQPNGVHDGTLYYQDKNPIMKTYHLLTEECGTAETDPTRTVYGGKYILKYDPASKLTRLYIAETGEALFDEMADLSTGVLAADEDGFVVSRSKVVYPEGQDYGTTEYMICCYIRYDALADGLQLSDCLQLWRKDYNP